jgi:hypothetical protein
MVDVVQSPGASLAVAALASKAVLSGIVVAAFEPITLVVALVVAEPVFLTISAEFFRSFW